MFMFFDGYYMYPVESIQGLKDYVSQCLSPIRKIIVFRKNPYGINSWIPLKPKELKELIGG